MPTSSARVPGASVPLPLVGSMAVMQVSVPARTWRLTAGAIACTSALSAMTACSSAEQAEPEAAPTSAPTHDSALAADALPDVPRESMTECPYLDTQFVADANGQKVTSQGTDTRFDTPACVFWSYPEEPQLQVIIRHTESPAAAREVVDWAAPVDLTDPAEQPDGWSGGRAGGGTVPGFDGAVYAVAKDTTAVVVLTNQKESVKAQAIAEQAIANLAL